MLPCVVQNCPLLHLLTTTTTSSPITTALGRTLVSPPTSVTQLTRSQLDYGPRVVRVLMGADTETNCSREHLLR